MADIRYTPISGGQTFGDPGSIFRGAAKSLNKATTGLSDAFDTFRQGSIDARDQRTRDAVASIQGATSQEQLAGIDPTAFDRVDNSQIINALNEQGNTIQTRADEGFAREQALLGAQDAQLKRESIAKDTADNDLLNQIYVDLITQNPKTTSGDFIKVTTAAGIPVAKAGEFSEGIRKFTGQERIEKSSAAAEKTATKGVQTALDKFDATDDRLGLTLSSQQEATKLVGELAALGMPSTEILQLLNQSQESAFFSDNSFDDSIMKAARDALQKTKNSQELENDFKKSLNLGNTIIPQ